MPTRQRVHVHHLVDTLSTGGAEVLLTELARVAGDHALRLTVGYLQDKGGSGVRERLLEAGIEVRLVHIGPRLGADAWRRTRAHLKAVAPDLLHTHLTYSDLLGGFAARSIGLPAVSTLHLAPPHDGTPAIRARVRLAALARRVGCRRIIAVSEHTRRAYLARGWDRPDRVITLHNGVQGHAQPGAGIGAPTATPRPAPAGGSPPSDRRRVQPVDRDVTIPCSPADTSSSAGGCSGGGRTPTTARVCRARRAARCSRSAAARCAGSRR